MVYRGTVRNGVVQIEGDQRPPDGTRVNIEPLIDVEPIHEASDALSDIGRRAVPIGRSDLATNLDHYLYGHPKVSDEQR
ncbi:MAG: hypothetical protein IT450_13075 [Phycisphaerales bacterium]|nr:hypothetical protein [Phycisphaerales bacterium]